MNVSLTQLGAPIIAPSVNVNSEQAARDNRTREAITPTVALTTAGAGKKVKDDEKRRKDAAWDPNEHPNYELDDEKNPSDKGCTMTLSQY